MNKQFFQKIYIGLALTILGIGMFLASPVFAQDNLVVKFEATPLFDEANFLPGESVSRWVKVTNNSGESQRIATEAINKNDPNRLGDTLNLEIKEKGSRLYNDALSKFFATGEVFLSDLASGSTTQYDFIVTFYSGTSNPFQGKKLSFDILVGFQGTEGGIIPGAGGGAGGYLPPGLTIQDELVRITELGQTSVIITWPTSYFSTSQVVYDTSSGKFDLTKPNYGYAYSKEGDDSGLEKVTFHSVTLTGLVSGTKYYFRCVSHGSLAISQEHSFTTLVEEKTATEEEVSEEEESAGEVPVVEISLEEPASVPLESGTPAAEEEGLVEEPSLAEVAVEERPIINLTGLLAAIGKIPLNLKIILAIIFLVLIGLIILRLIKKKKK